MYESALERQIKPRKRRKMPDSGVFIIHWNITSSMKLFYLTSYTNRWHTQWHITLNIQMEYSISIRGTLQKRWQLSMITG